MLRALIYQDITWDMKSKTPRPSMSQAYCQYIANVSGRTVRMRRMLEFTSLHLSRASTDELPLQFHRGSYFTHHSAELVPVYFYAETCPPLLHGENTADGGFHFEEAHRKSCVMITRSVQIHNGRWNGRRNAINPLDSGGEGSRKSNPRKAAQKPLKEV